MRQTMLDKLQVAVRDGRSRLFYFDEAGFLAGPPVQRSRSPRGLPHAINSHCRRSIIGALDFGNNALIHTSQTGTIKALHVFEFIEALLQHGDGKPTVIVLDDASIRHSIDQATLDRWFIEHKTLLFYLPPCSPAVNLIEIVWKHFEYHWRRFLTWTNETIDAELAELLNRYDTKFHVNFS
jgi:transposase